MKKTKKPVAGNLAAEYDRSDGDPLDCVLGEFLLSIPSTWKNIDLDKLTQTQGQALNRLTEVGLVEERLDVTATMDGFPDVVRLRCQVSGDYGQMLRCRALERVPEWCTSDGLTKGHYQIIFGPPEVRLTAEGERAKQDWQKSGPSYVLKFAKTATVKGTVVVETSQINDGPFPPSGEPDTMAIDLVDIKGVAKLVHRAKKTVEKRCKDWPSPVAKSAGSIPAMYSYEALLPILRDQYPEADLPIKPPRAE